MSPMSLTVLRLGSLFMRAAGKAGNIEPKIFENFGFSLAKMGKICYNRTNFWRIALEKAGNRMRESEVTGVSNRG
ncbi:hypothetical protein [Pseudoflavonifractor sp. 60]|uniref:hypothetical protein n=1 Tax=Pseudoflavonifractor sp. 60 TaxID=2304576 RepID=UPI00136C3166|nr:hypothetical protein [Pseudoflavonifractor sp. 60]